MTPRESLKLSIMATCLVIPMGFAVAAANATPLKCSTGLMDKGATDATGKEEIRWLPTMLATYRSLTPLAGA